MTIQELGRLFAVLWGMGSLLLAGVFWSEQAPIRWVVATILAGLAALVVGLGVVE